MWHIFPNPGFPYIRPVKKPLNPFFMALLVLSAYIWGCSGTGGGQPQAIAQNSGFTEVPGWLGIYQDTLYCENCAGALTRIEFSTGNRYRKAVTLLGKGPAIENTWSTEGTWKTDPTGIITLDQKAENNWTGFRAVNDTTLIQCNPMGELFPGTRNDLKKIRSNRF